MKNELPACQPGTQAANEKSTIHDLHHHDVRGILNLKKHSNGRNRSASPLLSVVAGLNQFQIQFSSNEKIARKTGQLHPVLHVRSQLAGRFLRRTFICELAQCWMLVVFDRAINVNEWACIENDDNFYFSVTFSFYRLQSSRLLFLLFISCIFCCSSYFSVL